MLQVLKIYYSVLFVDFSTGTVKKLEQTGTPIGVEEHRTREA